MLILNYVHNPHPTIEKPPTFFRNVEGEGPSAHQSKQNSASSCRKEKKKTRTSKRPGSALLQPHYKPGRGADFMILKATICLNATHLEENPYRKG